MSKRTTRTAKLSAEEVGKLAFQRFWECRATPADQRIVLDTLAHWCGWNASPFHKDPRVTEMNMGAQKVFLQLQKAAGVTSPFAREAGLAIDEPGDERRDELKITGE